MVTQILVPASIKEASEVIAAGKLVSIAGLDQHRDWRCETVSETLLSTRKLNRILRIESADQVCEVESGIDVSELQEALAEKGQCLPWLPFDQLKASVGGAVSLNLPHRHEGHWGSWRDWVLGLSVILPGGELARAGNSAVKNVAGYDFHRFMAGARGSLGVIATIILRTLPLAVLTPPECDPAPSDAKTMVLQRVLRSDAESTPHYPKSVYNPSSQTLCVCDLPANQLKRFPHDWIMGRGFGHHNLEPLDADQALFWRMIKQKIDPNGQFGTEQFPMEPKQ